MKTKTSTRKLIATVKKYPCLYDPDHDDYQDTEYKEQLWANIAAELNRDSKFLKTKWGNTRDNYTRYVNFLKLKKCQKPKEYGKYMFAEDMEFVKPYLRVTRNSLVTKDTTAPSDSREETENNMTAVNKNEDIICQCCAIVSQDIKEETEIQSRTSNADNFMSYLENTDSSRIIFSDDAIDLLFLGLAESVKAFSSERQAATNLKIVNLILEQKAQQRAEEENSSLNIYEHLY